MGGWHSVVMNVSHLFAGRALEGAALAPLAPDRLGGPRRVVGEVAGREQVLERALFEVGDESADVPVMGVGSRTENQACILIRGH